MTIDLHTIAIDAADAARVADFWSAALGRPLDPDPTPEFASIGLSDADVDGDPRGPGWLFLQVPEPKQGKNRVHVDLATTDLEGAVQRLVGLGAKRLADLDESGTRWTTLADPEGNEFDVVQVSGSERAGAERSGAERAAG